MKKAFTLIELLTVIAILGLLAALLFPVLASSRKSSYKTTCQANLRTLGNAVRLYVDDYDGQWPSGSVWNSWNRPAGVFPASARGAAPKLEGCPQATVPSNRVEEFRDRGYILGYAYNSNINFKTDKDFVHPSTTVIFLDAAIDRTDALSPDPYEGASPYPYNVEKGYERHNGGGNYLFCDGHVKLYRKNEVLSWKQGNNGTKPSFALNTEKID